MSFLRPSAAKQTTVTTGPGALTLTANAGDTRSLQEALGVGPVPCRAMLRGNGYFEMFRGTFTAPDLLTRDEVIISSNSNNLVSIPPGTSDVYLLDYAQFQVERFTGNKVLANQDASNTFVFTGVAAASISLPAISSALPDFWSVIKNAGTALLTVVANGADTIDENGLSSTVLRPGQSAFVFLDYSGGGTSLWRILRNAPLRPLRGHLDGLTLSTVGSSTTFTVGQGEASDGAVNELIELGSALAKTTAGWAVGAAQGALDTGSIANSTWYHVFLIKRPDTGVVDVLISLSATAPSMPANYTLKRRIGSLKTTSSGNWRKFTQRGDLFILTGNDQALFDYSFGAGTGVVNMSADVPNGVPIECNLVGYIQDAVSNPGSSWIFQDPAEGMNSSDTAFNRTASGFIFNSTVAAMAVDTWRTTTSATIRAWVLNGGSFPLFRMMIPRYKDRRGKDQ